MRLASSTHSPPREQRDWLPFVLGAILVLGTFLVYSPIRFHEFINVDDPQYISRNPQVQAGLTWPGIKWAFRGGHESNWHPLTWLSQMLDVSLFGLNPGAHHLVNVLFHALNSLLILLLFRQMTGALWPSFFVAAFFAWHPLHVESVAWASERKDVLSTLFWLLTMMVYVRYARGPSRPRYAWVLILFALGLMTKPMVVTLPFVLLLLDFWPLHRTNSIAALVKEKIPFFLLTFLACLITYAVQKSGGAMWAGLPLGFRIANAFLAYGRYLFKTLVPVQLSPIYPYPDHWPVAEIVASAVLLVSLSIVFVSLAKRHSYLLVGWCWFLGTLVPTIGLVQVGPQSMADRYMYIPGIGLFLIIVWGLNELLSVVPAKQKLLAITGLAATAACLVGTWKQLSYWQNGETLFRRAVQLSPDNYVAYDYLGMALAERNQVSEALGCYHKSLELHPRNSSALYNLGTILMGQKDLENAGKYLTQAVADNPRNARAKNNLGCVLLKQGKLEASGAQFREALAIDSEDPEFHYNLATVLMEQSQLRDAVAEFSKALEQDPNYAAAHANLGVISMRIGAKEQGLAEFSEAVRCAPTNADYHFNLGLACSDQQRFNDAATQFRETLRLGRNDAATHYRLAVALAHEANVREAIVQYRAALQLTPEFPEALNELAWILATDSDPSNRNGLESVRLAERACELTKNEQPEFLLTLAAAYAETGRLTDATATAEKARTGASTKSEKDLLSRADELLKVFQSGKPFRQAR